MLALCQHNTLAYYAFCYAGILDAGLACAPFFWAALLRVLILLKYLRLSNI